MNDYDVTKMMQIWRLKNASFEWQADRNLVLAVVSKNGRALAHASLHTRAR
mgnify:CR=1 FL=1